MSTKNNIPIKPSDDIIEALLQAFTYDAETGEFKHNLDRPRSHFRTEHGYKSWLGQVKNNPVIGSIDTCSGYVQIGFTHPLLEKQKKVKAHHLAWLLHHKEWPTSCIDHINGEKTDNRIVNLRIVTHRQNGHNRADQSVLGVGVTVNGNNYRSQIKILGVKYTIGTYSTANIAATAYDCVLLSFSDNYNTGPNGLDWCDLEKSIASVPNLAEKIEDIRSKVAEKLTETQHNYKEELV